MKKIVLIIILLLNIIPKYKNGNISITYLNSVSAQGNIYGSAANTLGGIGYSTLQSMMPTQAGSVNNGGSYSDFGVGAGQVGNTGFTPTAGNSFTFSTGG